MEKRRQVALAAQLHAQLLSHMTAIARLSFLSTGRAVHPVQMVGWMETALESECARIGTEPSAYDEAELRIRVRIAQQVVANIAREVRASS